MAWDFDVTSPYVDGTVIRASVSASSCNLVHPPAKCDCHRGLKDAFHFAGGAILFPSNPKHLGYLTKMNGAFPLKPQNAFNSKAFPQSARNCKAEMGAVTVLALQWDRSWVGGTPADDTPLAQHRRPHELCGKDSRFGHNREVPFPRGFSGRGSVQASGLRECFL